MKSPWRNRAKRKYVARDPRITSGMMSKVKSRDSKAEKLLRRELWRRGWRYRIHSKILIGKPDVVFRKYGLIVFVDGDFWHGRALRDEGVEGLKRGLRTDRADWWISKIQKTVLRDDEVTKVLEESGWKVLRFWESEIIANLESIVQKIEYHLNDRAPH